jgi:hypothetical protein
MVVVVLQTIPHPGKVAGGTVRGAGMGANRSEDELLRT